MLTWPTLRCRADIDHVAVGTAFLLVGSAFLLLAIANPPDAWMLRMAAGLVVRIAFSLLGVAARGRIPAGQMGTGWVPVLLGAVAGPDERYRSLVGAGWTLPGSHSCCLGARSYLVVSQPCWPDRRLSGFHS
jgi:hypothetical protein